MHAIGILGLDTATADATVAVTIEGEPVSERVAPPDSSGRARHAAALMTEVEAAVAEAGGWERIGLLAVGIGPGTFTGLRIGIATARALAQGRGLGLAPVGSLKALARGIGARAPGHARLAIIDARRREAFAAAYDASGGELLKPFVAEPEELCQRLGGLPGSVLAGGDGSLRFRRQLESAGVEVLPEADPAHRIAARHVCALAERIEPVSPTDVRPAYLRRPDAEVWREQRDRNPG